MSIRCRFVRMHRSENVLARAEKPRLFHKILGYEFYRISDAVLSAASRKASAAANTEFG